MLTKGDDSAAYQQPGPRCWRPPQGPTRARITASSVTAENLHGLQDHLLDRSQCESARFLSLIVTMTIQPALPLMKSGGTFVLIRSTASITPPPAMSLYGGAKAAVRCMVRSWIQDIKGSG